MIKEISFERLCEICQTQFKKRKPDVLLSRLCANAKCFEPKRLCNVYEIENRGKVCAVLCRYGGSGTLCVFKKPDLEELCAFLCAAPITTLECDALIGRKLSKKLALNKICGEAMVIKSPKNFIDYKVFETPNVLDFFDVLKAADPFYKNTSYEEYYCDIFYRSELPARLFLAEYDGKAAATAGIMHSFNNISIISDVSVLPQFRRRGLGGTVVAKISQILLSEGKVPTLLCTLASAKRLYKKIGFKRCGRFCLLSFSQNTKDGR
ncbi:MAG: GNAT family N-acetyltransferase [Oscillospiraceae bacterium]|nr:GNAT family N-acetyltransferase [Oscillospiraceae bacterium]